MQAKIARAAADERPSFPEKPLQREEYCWMYSLPSLQDDGLVTPVVGEWGERKYVLVQNYAAMFSTSMKGKWDCLVYIDLFAGPGRAKLEGNGKIVSASPLLALGVTDRFDYYIFCEADPERMQGLRERVERDFSDAKCTFLEGDANSSVAKVLEALPRHGKGRKVLGLCFSDPYNLKGLHFDTIRQLSDRFMDHLVLIPTHMDANRNISYYLRDDNTTLDEFLGGKSWRERWLKAERAGVTVDRFLVAEFSAAMEQLKYLDPGMERAPLIRSANKNLPLYRLMLFSRHKLGSKFWDQAQKYSTPQTDLFQ